MAECIVRQARRSWASGLLLVLLLALAGCARQAHQPAVTETLTQPHLHSLLEAGEWTTELQALLNEPDVDLFIHHQHRSAMDIGLASENPDIRQHFEQRLRSQRSAIAEAHYYILGNDVDGMDALVRRGLYLNVHQFPQSPTHLVEEAVRLQHTDILAYLLNTGMNPGLTSASDWTALHLAVNDYYPEGVELLLAAGAPVDAVTNQGWTPLFLTMNGDNDFSDIATQLVLAGADIEHTLPGGRTALMLAAQKQRQASLTNLLDLGANVAAREDDGWTALIYAANRGFVPGIEALVDAGADLNEKSEGTWTPLMFAVDNGHIDSVRELLAQGAAVNLPNSSDWTPLHFTVNIDNDHADIAQLLIEHGARVDAPQYTGYTPLHLAALGGHNNTLQVLADAGANIDNRHETGRTPLMEAAENGHLATVELLLALDADARAESLDAETALQLARDNEHSDIVQLLRSH